MDTRLLVVEDNPSLAAMIGRQLYEARPDWSIMPAHSCGEARKVFGYGAVPDAALLDVNLPDGNGIELLSEFKSAAPHLPVVMMTGLYSDDLHSRAIRGGAYSLLEKPFSANDLINTLEGAVRLSRFVTKLYHVQHTTALALREPVRTLALRPRQTRIALYAPLPGWGRGK
jgi:DNA-binding NtrC family response regulator